MGNSRAEFGRVGGTVGQSGAELEGVGHNGTEWGTVIKSRAQTAEGSTVGKSNTEWGTMGRTKLIIYVLCSSKI